MFELFTFNETNIAILFLTLFVIGVVILFLLSRFASYIFENIGIYKRKSINLLNKSEANFFTFLEKAIPPSMYICPKVRIADLVDVNLPEKGRGFWLHFNKISQKHVDFVICKKEDFSPLLIVELDGISHLSSDRKQRDRFVNKVFKSINIPILHIKVSQIYDVATISKNIVKIINEEKYNKKEPILV